MPQLLPSTNPQWASEGWYRMPTLAGVEYATFRKARPPHDWVWGKRHMIAFLGRVWEEWMLAFWTSQTEEFGNSAPILLGDISPEGGVGPTGSVKISKQQKAARFRVRGHVSHKDGIDADIYFVRKDGRNAATHFVLDPAGFDLARTTILAKCIFRASRGDVERVFCDIGDIIKQIAPRPPRVLQFGPVEAAPHGDHFHIRLYERG
jgi:murein endopeptidase